MKTFLISSYILIIIAAFIAFSYILGEASSNSDSDSKQSITWQDSNNPETYFDEADVYVNDSTKLGIRLYHYDDGTYIQHSTIWQNGDIIGTIGIEYNANMEPIFMYTTDGRSMMKIKPKN
jgi:hypothetical protein